MINLDFRWPEASTKRGLALFITGGLALGQALTSADGLTLALLSQETFWLALGTLTSGLIGMFQPDTPAGGEGPTEPPP